MVNTKHILKSANLYDPIARVCSWKSKSVRALMARRLLLGVTELSCPKVANTHPGPPSWKTTDMPGVVCRESGGDFRRNGRCSESQGAPQGESMPSIFSLPRGSLVPLLGSADVQSVLREIQFGCLWNFISHIKTWGILKNDLPFAWFFGPERDAPFWTLVGGFRRFSSGFKRRNTVIYGVFVRLAWQKYVLQHAENCVNTTVFARCWP
jgi:hypothetical protein